MTYFLKLAACFSGTEWSMQGKCYITVSENIILTSRKVSVVSGADFCTLIWRNIAFGRGIFSLRVCGCVLWDSDWWYGGEWNEPAAVGEGRRVTRSTVIYWERNFYYSRLQESGHTRTHAEHHKPTHSQKHIQWETLEPNQCHEDCLQNAAVKLCLHTRYIQESKFQSLPSTELKS